MRAIANGIISYAGTAFGHFAGVTVGMAGYLMIAATEDIASKLPLYWVGISIIGDGSPHYIDIALLEPFGRDLYTLNSLSIIAVFYSRV